MKTMIFVSCLCLMLVGCSTVISHLPSSQDCGDVVYIRHGEEVTLQALCEMKGAHPTQQGTAESGTPDSKPDLSKVNL